MTRWGEIKCPSCAEQDALWEGMERALEESDAREARSRRWREDLERWLKESETREETLNDRITMLEEHLCLTEEKLMQADGALSICSASWGECNRILDDTKAKLAQQEDDDFHPASAGDDPIWLGGVEYITRQRSDDLVQAAVAAKLTEADQAIQSVASNCTTEDGHVAIVAAVEKVRSLITPDAQAALDRVVAAERERCARVAFDAGCGWQALRTAALSSSWPEDAAKHLASEHAAFAIAAAIREGGK